LDDYRAIAIGWVLHTCWDIAHHLYGNPIIPFEATSSIGCAVCDLGLAAWYFAGAPTIWKVGSGRRLEIFRRAVLITTLYLVGRITPAVPRLTRSRWAQSALRATSTVIARRRCSACCHRGRGRRC
jgi:hypothetical protein